MSWIILSYTLPTVRANSSARVALWRRLKRLGVISPISGLQVLPSREPCIEAFNWLVHEIRQEGGEALVIYCDQFGGLTTEQVIVMFCEARRKDYEDLIPDGEVTRSGLNKLRKQFAEIKSIDYFNCPEGLTVEKKLEALERRLQGEQPEQSSIPRALVADYQGKGWVTRPRPHVDRLGCAWLIRHFIDPEAIIRYDAQPMTDEISFDMPDGVFTHHGNFCTFETMIQTFGFHHDPALLALAEIVHEIDLRDGVYQRLETAGVEAILQGWLLNDFSNEVLETHGIALFAGLYAMFSYRQQGK
jgi:hypothetical protein